MRTIIMMMILALGMTSCASLQTVPVDYGTIEIYTQGQALPQGVQRNPDGITVVRTVKNN